MNTIRNLLTFVFALTAVAVAQADYDVVVTGTTSGVVWGSGPYTSDSSIAAASVHAGILVVGQTGTIRVHPVGTLSNFSGSTQNGVTTYSYASSWSAVTLSIAPGSNAPVPTVSAPSSANVSTQFEVIASASDADGNLTSMAVVREDTGLVESWSVSGNSAYNSTHVTAPSAAGVIRVRTEATDAAGVTRASEWAAISIVGGSNVQPSVTLTPSVSSVPPGGSFNAIVRAQDPDANLVSLAVSDYISGQQSFWWVSGGDVSRTSNHDAPGYPTTIYLRGEATDAGTTVASGWQYISVTGTPPPASLSLSSSSVPQGGVLTVTYTNAPNSSSWVGLYSTSSGDTQYLLWQTVPNSGTGSVDFTLPGYWFPTSGTYEARLFSAGNYNRIATSSTFQTSAGNNNPTALFTASPTSGLPPLSVSFNGSGSSDPDGYIQSHYWTFGDGGTATGVSTSHVYNSAGTFQATLIVTDNSGATANFSRTIVVGDASAPSVPGTPQYALTSASSFDLWWTASTDNVDVASYDIFVNNIHYGTSTIPSASVTGQTGTPTVFIRARDAAGNQSGASATVTVNLGAWQDTEPPNPPTGLTASQITDSGAVLTWSGPSDAASYKVYQNGVAVMTAIETTATVTGLLPLSPYTYQVTAVDSSENESAGSNTIQITTLADTTAPGTPQNFRKTSSTATKVTVAWDPAPGSQGVVEYSVRRSGSSPITTTLLSVELGGMSPQTYYTFYVKARDAVYNWSAEAPLYTNTASDTTPPKKPNAPSLVQAQQNVLRVNWSMPADPDDVGVTGYQARLDGNTIPDVLLGGPVNLYAPTPNHPYYVSIRAKDAADNWGEFSDPTIMWTLPDTTPPANPSGLEVQSISSTGMRLVWNASADSAAFLANRTPAPVQPYAEVTTRYFDFTGLTPGTSYTLKVKARDAYGNWSGEVSTNASTTPVAPVIHSASNATGSFATDFSYTITAANTPTSFAASNLPIGLSLNTTTGVISGQPTQIGSRVVALQAANAGGQSSVFSLNLTIGKALPVGTLANQIVYNQGVFPITPQMLSASFKHPTNTTAPAPTGTITYSGYRPSTGDTYPNLTASTITPGLSAWFKKLLVTASYAGDANYLPATVTAEFEDRDTEPPTIPVDLTRALLGSTAFSLHWAESTDASGGPPPIYEVTLNGGNDYVESPRNAIGLNDLQPSTTYTVKIRSKDGFGNRSAWSSPITVTTLAASDPNANIYRWVDVNNDNIRDQIFADESHLRLDLFDPTVEYIADPSWSEEFFQWYSAADAEWMFYFGFLTESIAPDNYFVIETIRGRFTMLVEPGYGYAICTVPNPTTIRRILGPEVFNPDGPSAIPYIHETQHWPVGAFAYPMILAKISKPIGSVSATTSGGTSLGSTSGLGTSRGSGPTLQLSATVGGNAVLNVKDLLGAVLGSGHSVAWEVWDAITGIKIGNTTLGDTLSIGINSAGKFQIGIRLDDSSILWLNFEILPNICLAVDANRDGILNLPSESPSDNTSAAAPFRFWLNDDDDNGDGTPDANDGAVNGTADLDDFYPVFLDLKSLVAAMPPSSTVKYKLKQDDGAVNFVYTNLTRATAFSYVGGSLGTGFGPSFNQAASSAAVQQVTAAGVDLFDAQMGGSSQFLDAIQNHDGGVILMEGRQVSDKPLILQVVKDGSVVAEARLEMVAMHLGKLWETSNKANQIFNCTRKDDPNNPNDPTSQEVEGDATYGLPRNNLYVVADPNDNKLKVSLDLGIPATSRSRFLVAAWDGTTKVSGSDAALPTDASQPANLQIAASANAETKEYRLKLGVDANGNGLLDDNEATVMEVYRRRDSNELRFATVKGISNAKYTEHRSSIENRITLWGVQSQPDIIAKYARSFLSLFYYKGDVGTIKPSVRPEPIVSTQQLDAFANGAGFAEWLTHNSGATFSDAGVATIKEYTWLETSEVAEFFALRTPFALEAIVNNSQGYYEFQTDTGTALKAFYTANVKTAAEQALQNGPVGTTVTYPPLNQAPYSFPRAESPNLFKSISPGSDGPNPWIPPSTQNVGTDDGHGGWAALPTDILAGTDQFKDFDAFATVGRGRVLNPQYRITVKKEDSSTYKVSAVEFICDVADLYDFNYENGPLPSDAAALQIGWGKGANGSARDQGVIYRHKIHIDHTYSYPFDQTVIPYPP